LHHSELRAAIRKQPFDLFAVVMSSGDSDVIRHPENINLTKNTVVISYHTQSSKDDLPDDLVLASYLHVAAIEQAPASRSRRRK
jgi:hypothetical protein